ncbi:hypothetical protein H072_1618 [Dactylellina haptotyla CBS 200.50]|uniref:Senescence domain-containing protein n=1 Tax=Dactylellina haptotyla (strain CBS 200.50) TaxID=1284197 RepID=S8ANH1_DACHA|nr:hypothetical protein H072_1618 [Dactylellina haptotyla CBS 200.50]
MSTAPLISIKNVIATQIPPSAAAPIPLKSGTLTLTEPLAGTIPTEAKLFLTITPSEDATDPTPLTIPIHPELFLGSKSGLCQTFRFQVTKELGTIEVRFPENLAEEDALNFEKIMIYNGFLKTGIVAEADNIGKKIAETASNVASYLSRKTDDRNEQAPLPEAPTEFSDITKEVVGTTEHGTEKLAETTAVIGGAISDAVYNAGTWIGEKTGLKPGANGTNGATNGLYDINGGSSPEQPKSLARETLDQTLEGGAIAGKQLIGGIKTVGTAVGDSASKVAQHDYGDDAQNLVDSTRQTGANMGGVVVDAVVGTSVVVNAARAGVGATKDEKEEGKS